MNSIMNYWTRGGLVMEAIYVFFILMSIAMMACLWLSTPKKRVMIALSETLGKNDRHGIVWVKAQGGGLVSRPFITEQPWLLEKMHYSQVMDIFHQVAKLGMNPERLEITAGGRQIVYQYGKREPILAI